MTADSSKGKVSIVDTTLRDGMQTPYLGVNLRKRLQIGDVIAKMGVNVMEIGMPANPLDEEIIPVLSTYLDAYHPDVEQAVLCRCSDVDLNATKRAFARYSGAPRVHLFLPASEKLRENSVNKSPLDLLNCVETYHKRFRDVFPNSVLQFTPEDGAAAKDKSFVFEMIDRAVNNGASVVNLADTTGWDQVSDYGNYVQSVVKRYSSSGISVSAHCHNDAGLAVANTLEAVAQGATQIEGCVLGFGERAGNTDWGIVAANLHYRGLQEFDMQKIATGYKGVSSLLNVSIPFNYPVFGRNAHATSSGVHSRANGNSIESYHRFDPHLVGKEYDLVLGQTSGMAAYKQKFNEWHISLDGLLEMIPYMQAYATENGFVSKKIATSYAQVWANSVDADDFDKNIALFELGVRCGEDK